MIKFSGWLAGLLVVVGLVGGCLQPAKREIKYLGNKDLSYYKDVATQIDYPAVCEPTAEQASFTAPPQRVRHPRKDAPWDMPLVEALHLALANSQIIRERDQFLSPRNPLLTNPMTISNSIYDPAIQETDVVGQVAGVPGSRGVEAALADFDTQWTTSMLWGRNEQLQNNLFSSGVVPGSTLVEESAAFGTRLEKQFADSGLFAVSHNWNYSLNNVPSRLFGSAYTGFLRAEYRRPLLAGAGTEYTRIAGPASRDLQNFNPVNRGVVISRINTDISLSDFEAAVRNLLKETEDLYWELALTYRTYDAEQVATHSALATYRDVQARLKEGLIGGGAADEAQARDNYFESRSRRENALADLYAAEARLRRLIGLPLGDGRVIRPVDEPVVAEFVPDWHLSLAEALTRRVELRRQKWLIKSLQLQLKAARSLTRPRMDFVSSYQVNAFGDRLFGENDNDGLTPQGLRSGYETLTQGDQTGWNAGLEFSMPIGFRSAQAYVQNLELRLAKARAALAAIEMEISHELGFAFQQLDRWYLTAQTNFNRRRAAEARVNAALAEYEFGRTTVDLLLRAQISLAQAEISYYQSLVEYNKSIADIHYRKGTLLEHNHVHLAEGLWEPDAYLDALRRAWERSHARDAHFQKTEPAEFVSQDAGTVDLWVPDDHPLAQPPALLPGEHPATSPELPGHAPAITPPAPRPAAPAAPDAGELPQSPTPAPREPADPNAAPAPYEASRPGGSGVTGVPRIPGFSSQLLPPSADAAQRTARTTSRGTSRAPAVPRESQLRPPSANQDNHDSRNAVTASRHAGAAAQAGDTQAEPTDAAPADGSTPPQPISQAADGNRTSVSDRARPDEPAAQRRPAGSRADEWAPIVETPAARQPGASPLPGTDAQRRPEKPRLQVPRTDEWESIVETPDHRKPEKARLQDSRTDERESIVETPAAEQPVAAPLRESAAQRRPKMPRFQDRRTDEWELLADEPGPEARSFSQPHTRQTVFEQPQSPHTAAAPNATNTTNAPGNNPFVPNAEAARNATNAPVGIPFAPYAPADNPLRPNAPNASADNPFLQSTPNAPNAPTGNPFVPAAERGSRASAEAVEPVIGRQPGSDASVEPDQPIRFPAERRSGDRQPLDRERGRNPFLIGDEPAADRAVPVNPFRMIEPANSEQPMEDPTPAEIEDRLLDLTGPQRAAQRTSPSSPARTAPHRTQHTHRGQRTSSPDAGSPPTTGSTAARDRSDDRSRFPHVMHFPHPSSAASPAVPEPTNADHTPSAQPGQPGRILLAPGSDPTQTTNPTAPFGRRSFFQTLRRTLTRPSPAEPPASERAPQRKPNLSQPARTEAPSESGARLKLDLTAPPPTDAPSTNRAARMKLDLSDAPPTDALATDRAARLMLDTANQRTIKPAPRLNLDTPNDLQSLDRAARLKLDLTAAPPTNESSEQTARLKLDLSAPSPADEPPARLKLNLN